MLLKNSLRVSFVALLLGVLAAGSALAADTTQAGGGGGTGSAANGSSGMGGTGAPALTGGIGGTGAPEARGGIGGTGGLALSAGIGGTGAPAGKVLFVAGHVEAQNRGQSRVLAKEDAVRAGDTLISGTGATLQLRMEDGGTIVLRPQSRLAIETFDYKGVQDGKQRMALMLQSGGFRAVTGEIGHLHKENYSIRTPNASVGIMGTDHETVFIPVPPSGQAAAVDPGTYNHVYSGATVLQSGNDKLLIRPNQTGFMAIKGSAPTLLNGFLPIFGGMKWNGGWAATQDSDSKNTGTDQVSGQEHSSSGAEQGGYGAPSANGQAAEGSSQSSSQNSNDTVQHTDQVAKAAGGIGQAPNTDQQNGSSSFQGGQTSNDPTQNTQNRVTQPDNLANSQVDVNTLENDGAPAPPGSAVVGAHLANGLMTVGTAQSGRAGDQLLVEDNVPGIYSNRTTGFNYVAQEDSEPIRSGTGTVDGITVTWGLYAGGVAFDSSGNAIAINFHPFAYASAGATPPSVISTIGGTATFSTLVGNTAPVTETGNVGGSVNLNAGVNLGNATLTSYNLAVTDASSRAWTGTLNGAVPLSTFAQSGAPLAVTCSGSTCGSGAGSGFAAGMLIGPNAKGLMTSYMLGTTTGQAVLGAAILSRP